MPMQISCRLTADDLDDDDLQHLVRDFAATVTAETDISAELATGASAPGTRGDPITLGTIALSFLSSGAAVALIKVLETYVSRRPSLEIELSRPDGAKLSVKSQDLNSEVLAKTQQTLLKFFRQPQ
jgi:Effector Associated Constant Component 1